MIATSANFTGLGIGALVAGVLAEYARWPLHLPFVVYLGVLATVWTLVWLAPETVAEPRRSIEGLSIKPRASVPSKIRTKFVAPAVTGFGSMALVGFYAALAPTVLANQLHITNHAIAGTIFLELAIVVAGTIVLARSLSSRTAMLAALALMLPAVAVLVAAQLVKSMLVLVVATAVCAAASGLGYRGSLQVTNHIALPERRAEIVSSYFICGFAGNALPVIGVGVIYGRRPHRGEHRLCRHYRGLCADRTVVRATIPAERGISGSTRTRNARFIGSLSFGDARQNTKIWTKRLCRSRALLFPLSAPSPPRKHPRGDADTYRILITKRFHPSRNSTPSTLYGSEAAAAGKLIACGMCLA